MILQGFDEYMNVVMDDAAEIYLKEDRASVPLGWVYSNPFASTNVQHRTSFT